MLQIAGGILLALLILAGLPLLIALLVRLIRGTAFAAGLAIMGVVALLPLVLLIAAAETLAPGYGVQAVVVLVIASAAGFMAWDTLRFRRWKRSRMVGSAR